MNFFFKHLLRSLFFVTILIFMTWGCKKDNPLRTIDNADVVAIIETSLQETASGITEQIKDLAAFAVKTAKNCDSGDTTLSGTNSGIIASTWELAVNFTTTCNNLNLPTQFSSTLTGKSNATTTKIATNANCNGAIDFKGFALNEDMLANGNLTRNGTETIKIGENITGTTAALIIGDRTFNLLKTYPYITDLKIEKANYTIVDGNLSFTLTITTPNENNKTFSGSIDITEYGKATLTIGDQTYEIDLK